MPKFLKSATSGSKKIFQIDKCFYWSVIRGLHCVNGSIHQQFCLDGTWALHLIQNSICPWRDPFLCHAMRKSLINKSLQRNWSCKDKVMQYLTTTIHNHRDTNKHSIEKHKLHKRSQVIKIPWWMVIFQWGHMLPCCHVRWHRGLSHVNLGVNGLH